MPKFSPNKPLLFIALTWLLLASAWAHEGIKNQGQFTLNAEEQAWLQAHSNLTMAIPINYPRSFHGKDGKLQGMDVDYVNLLEKKLGIQFKLISSEWNTALRRAMKHEVATILNADKMAYREPYLNFTDVYFASPQAVITPEHEATISDLNDLCGRKIAIHKGSSRVAYLQQHHPCIELLEVTSKKDILSAIVTKQADAGFDNVDSLIGHQKKLLLPNLKIIYFKYLPPTGFARIGVRKDWPTLANILNQAIASVTQEEKSHIVNKWLGVKLPPVPDLDDVNQGFHLSAAERRYLTQNVFKLAQADEWMPFTFKDANGAFVGIAVDYWKLITTKLGLRTEITDEMPFAAMLTAVQTGTLDVIASTSKTADRERYALFSQPYDSFPIAIAARKETPFISNLSLLSGQKVAVGRHYSAYHLLKACCPDIDFVLAEDTHTALALLEQEKVFAAIDVLPVLQYQLGYFPAGKIKLAGVSDVNFELSVMVGQQHARLLPLLNRAIASITETERQAIYKKWMHGSTIVTQMNYTLLWQIAGLLALIILIILYWNRKLAHEIARRTSVEEHLRKLSQAVDQSHSTIVITNLDACIEFANPAFSRATGYTLAEALGQNPRILQSGEHDAAFYQSMWDTLNSGKVWQGELYNKRKDGSLYWEHATISPIKNAAGKTTHYVAVKEDISAHKQAEHALRHSEQFVRTTIDALFEHLCVLDENGTILMVNQAWREFADANPPVPKDYGVGTNYLTVCHSATNGENVQDAALFATGLQSVLQGKQANFTLEYQCQTPRQSYWFVTHIKCFPNQQPMRLLVTHEDITRRKLAENTISAAKQAAEEALRDRNTILDNAVVGIILLKKRRFVWFNDHTVTLFGYAREELLNRSTEFLYANPVDYHHVGHEAPPVMARGEAYQNEYQYRRKDGSLLWCLISGKFINPAEPAQGTLYIAIDINARKQAEIQLHASEARYRAILDTTSEGYWLLDANHHTVEVNRALCEMLGYSADDMQGRAVLEFADAENQAIFKAHRAEATAHHRYEITLRGKANKVVHTIFHATMLYNDAAEVVGEFAFVSDITELKRATELLRQAEEKYRTVANFAYDWETWVSPEGRYLYISPACERITGYSTAEFNADPNLMLRIIYPEDKALVLHHFEHLNADNEVKVENEFRITTKDGQVRWIEHICHTVINEAGVYLGRRANNRDITERKQMELALQHSRAQYQGLLDDIGPKFVIYSHNADGILEYVSKGIKNIFGLHPKQAVGHHFGDIIPWLPGTLETTQEKLRYMLTTGKNVEPWEMHFNRPDNSVGTIVVSSHPVKDQDGCYNRIEGIVEDITERKLAEQALANSEQRFRMLVTSSPLPMLIVDDSPDNNIILINHRFKAVFGYTIEDVWDMHSWWPKAFPVPDYRRQIQTLWQASVEEMQASGAINIRPVSAEVTCADGSQRFVEVMMTLLMGHGLIIFNDLTERQRFETELTRAKEAAETANRAKSAFLANMSHELRTPLNAVLGYAQILQRDATLSKVQQQQVETIKRSGNYLLTLINDVLDLAKIEAGKLELTIGPCRLNNFFSELASLFQLRAKEKGIAFAYKAGTLPNCIEIDEKRLRQICMNLLSNAVKFTEKGKICLVVDYQVGELIIQVSDTGIGIPNQMQAEIFKPFNQVGEVNYKQQGTGLGLAISHSLVNQMQGKIGLDSQEGRGSHFIVRMPAPALGQTTHTDMAASSAQPASIIIGYQRSDDIKAPLRILVVDDEPLNRELLYDLLQPLGFDISEAVNGLDAVEMTAHQNFDVILMDVVMPKLDGLEATRRILARVDNNNKRIIALTARAFKEDRIECLAAGCCDYLSKPLDSAQFLNLLQTLLPLAWIYAKQSIEAEKNDAAMQNESTIVLNLPAQWFAALEQAVVRGHSKQILSLLTEVETQDAQLGAHLLKWAEQYEYQRLLNWIAQHKI